MAGWTAEGRVLRKESKGRATYCGTWLHVTEWERDRNQDHVPHHQAQMRGYPKIEVASRNETEENVISVSGFLTLLGKKGVHSLL